MLGFKSSKCKTACKLCVSRIKLLRNKREIQLTQQRRQIGQLLQEGKNEYAWIRIEAVIREKNILAAYEILELYLELISVRVELLAKNKSCPRDMVEAISTLMYAAPRVADLPELLEVRKWLSMKFGRELGVEGGRAYDGIEPPAWQVNLRLRQYLSVEAPEGEDKLSMISTIAQETGVKFNLEDYAQSVMVQLDSMVPAPMPRPSTMPYTPSTMPYTPYTAAGDDVSQRYPAPNYASSVQLTPTIVPPNPPPNYEPRHDSPVVPPAQPSFKRPPQTMSGKVPLDDDPEVGVHPSGHLETFHEDDTSYAALQKQYDSVPATVKKTHEEEDHVEPSAPEDPNQDGGLGIDDDLSRRLNELRKGL